MKIAGVLQVVALTVIALALVARVGHRQHR